MPIFCRWRKVTVGPGSRATSRNSWPICRLLAQTSVILDSNTVIEPAPHLASVALAPGTTTFTLNGFNFGTTMAADCSLTLALQAAIAAGGPHLIEVTL